MPHLVNALISILAVSLLLAGFSMMKRIALVVGLIGTMLVNFVAWMAMPAVWGFWAAPWLCSLVGAGLAVVSWALVRAFATPYTTHSGAARGSREEIEDAWTL